MTVEEILLDNGYEGIMTFAGPDYEDALIGVSDDNRAIYDFDLMVELKIGAQSHSSTK